MDTPDKTNPQEAMQDLEMSFAPGEASAREGEADWGLNRQRIPKKYQDHLRQFCRKIAQRDQFARIEEVRETVIRRFAWRGKDVCYNDKDSQWEDFGAVPSGSATKGDSDSGDISLHYPVNIFQQYGRNFITTVSEPWKIKMDALRKDSPDALKISNSADSFRRHIESQNDLEQLRQDASRLAWTDGRMVFYSRWVNDARFGYQEHEDETDQVEGMGGGEDPPKKQPRQAKGGELIDVGGVLEWKVPINVSNRSEMMWIQNAREIDVASGRAIYPWIAKTIKSDESGPGEYTFDRISRIACTQGLQTQQQTGDSIDTLPTRQRTWMRPAFFSEIEQDDDRQWFIDNYPDGVMVVFLGDTYCESRNESMDDHVNIVYPLPGDGQATPACGEIVMPVQGMVWDMMDLIMTTFMKCIPVIHCDKGLVNMQAISQQGASPGAHYPSKRDLEPNERMQDGFYSEPIGELPQSAMVFTQELLSGMPQGLTGLYPAAQGAADPDNQTAKGLTILRDQSKAQSGLAWQALRRGYAKSMTQLVRLGAYMRMGEAEEGIIKIDSPGVQQTEIDLEDLHDGNWVCLPDGDESYPNTHSERQLALKEFFAAAIQTPQGQALVMEPKNLLLYKESIGMDDLEIPGADSEEKQLGEIKLLLNMPPVPNIQAMMKFKVISVMAQRTGKPAPPKPPMEALYQSPIPIDAEFDDHQAEWNAGKDWINSPIGQQMKRDNPEGFASVRLHLLAHKAEVDKAQAQQVQMQIGVQAKLAQAKEQAKPAKTPAESINFKDLGPSGRLQVGKQAGLDLSADEGANLAHESMGMEEEQAEPAVTQ